MTEIEITLTTGPQGEPGVDGADGSPDTANQVAEKLGAADNATHLAAARTSLAVETTAQLDDRDTAILAVVAIPLIGVVEFSDATYRYYVGDTSEGWQVNRETIALPWVRTTAAGTINKPNDLAECQAEIYS